MIPEKIKSLLKENWGDKASAMNCYAEIKFIDTLVTWACYVYAMDMDENEICCLIYSPSTGLTDVKSTYADLQAVYNQNGDNPVVDHEYRRTHVTELLKRWK